VPWKSFTRNWNELQGGEFFSVATVKDIQNMGFLGDKDNEFREKISGTY